MSQQFAFLTPGRSKIQSHKELPTVVSWPGAKGWLAASLVPRLLPLLAERTYVEPFMGSGALFFALRCAGWDGCGAVLGDTNRAVIGLYKALQNNLAWPIWRWLSLWMEERKDAPKAHYCAIRHAFNHNLIPEGSCNKDDLDGYRAAMVIYLSRLGFNGLWRLNKKGEMTTAWGGADRELKLTLSTLEEAGRCLETPWILARDFGELFDMNHVSRALIYADPPYDGTFCDYQSGGFPASEQERLAQLLTQAADRGAIVLASNSDTPFIRSLYAGWHCEEIPIRFAIQGDGKRRVRQELLFSRGVTC